MHFLSQYLRVIKPPFLVMLSAVLVVSFFVLTRKKKLKEKKRVSQPGNMKRPWEPLFNRSFFGGS